MDYLVKSENGSYFPKSVQKNVLVSVVQTVYSVSFTYIYFTSFKKIIFRSSTLSTKHELFKHLSFVKLCIFPAELSCIPLGYSTTLLPDHLGDFHYWALKQTLDMYFIKPV